MRKTLFMRVSGRAFVIIFFSFRIVSFFLLFYGNARCGQVWPLPSKKKDRRDWGHCWCEKDWNTILPQRYKWSEGDKCEFRCTPARWLVEWHSRGDHWEKRERWEEECVNWDSRWENGGENFIFVPYQTISDFPPLRLTVCNEILCHRRR